MSQIRKAAEEARKETFVIAAQHNLTGDDFREYVRVLKDLLTADEPSSFEGPRGSASPLPFPTIHEELDSLKARVRALEDQAS